MSDLIDRQALLETLREEYQDPSSPEEVWFNLGAGSATRIIKHIPSAEKRGRWIEDGYYERCPECGEHADELHNYCPNCGARMENNNGK